MGCITSTPAVAPIEVVSGVFETWGAGGFNDENAEENTKKFFTEDCSMSFSSGTAFKNSDMFKTYSGHTGMLEFTRRLLEIEFVDFTPKIVSSSKDAVLIAATYHPTNKASGRTTDAPLTDYMEWTVTKGKVKKVVITIPDALSMDALFLSEEEATAIVGGCTEAWGTGKWSDPSSKVAKEAFAAFMSDDIVVYADASMKNTDGFKTYEGKEGFFAWLKFLESITFSHFTVEDMKLLGGTVVARVRYTPSIGDKKGALATDMQTWTLAGGKINSVKFYWGDSSNVDALFA